MADYANQKKILYLAAEALTDAITLSQGNRYTFRIRPNNFMQVGMAGGAGRRPRAQALGHRGAELRVRPIGSGSLQAPPEGEDAGRGDRGGAVPSHWARSKPAPPCRRSTRARPDGIFNVLFGADLTQFVREGNTRGLFEKRTVLSLLTGEPEWLLPLKEEVPEGWIVTGYPWDEIKDPKHKAFVDAYRAKFNDTPRLGSPSAT